jgi:peptide-methionine (S)-S-oxide reductase
MISILLRYFLIILFLPVIAGCNNHKSNSIIMTDHKNSSAGRDTATLGMGCFWCSEAVYQQLKGVISITPGYSGGKTKNPSYSEVCTGQTGHAEVVQIIYDTSLITFEEILEVFWIAHDPTTLNRQGADYGTQYRSVIFFHDPEQKEIAETIKTKLNSSGTYPDPVITEIAPFTGFYPAEENHMDYFNKNGQAPYCKIVIAPKVEKVRKVFRDKLKQLTTEKEKH